MTVQVKERSYIVAKVKDMKYTYEELQIMLDETEKAFDVMRKFAEVTNEFLMRENVKPLYQKFLIEKASK